MKIQERILPKCELGTVIFIPSYFDFVRIRNHLKNENESFVQLHEYAKEGKVTFISISLYVCFYEQEEIKDIGGNAYGNGFRLLLVLSALDK